MASARPSAAASDVFPGAPHRRGAARIKSSLDRWPTPIRPAQSKGKSMTVNIRHWPELKKPSNLEIKAGSAGTRTANSVPEPLARGLGLKPGHALDDRTGGVEGTGGAVWYNSA